MIKTRMFRSALISVFVLVFMMILNGCTNSIVKYELQFIVDNVVYYSIDTAGDEVITMPTNPTKEGSEFDGWYWDNNVWQNPFTVNSLLNQSLSSDMKVYAKWKAEDEVQGTEANFMNFVEIDDSTYSIKVNNDEQTINFSNVVKVASNSSWTLNTDIYANNSIPSKIGTLEIGDNTYYVLVTAQTGDLKLYTLNIRRLPLYNVTYRNSFGTTLKTIQAQEESFVNAIELDDVRGYTFDCWQYDFTNPIMRDTTIVAKYNANQYKITYHSNYDEDEIIERDVLFNSSFNLISLNRTGYEIAYWSTNKDGTGEQFYNTINYQGYTYYNRSYKYTYDVNLELYANWEVITYNVTYDLDYGNNSTENPTSYTINSDTIILQDANKVGYNFLGWYEYASFNDELSRVDRILGTDLKSYQLYAKFELINSTLSFELNSDNNTYKIIGCGEDETDLILPEYYNGKKVVSIGSSAFKNCRSLTTITIPSCVTSICESTFFGCSRLTSITIPSSVTSIGEGAFSGCCNLEEITLPFVGGSIKSSSDTYQYPFGYIFGTRSYYGGTSISQKYHGNSTSSTTSTTYYIPTSLRSVTITGGNILYGAFYNCSMLTSITIGSGVSNINDYAFYNCGNLTTIVIPNSVTSIGDSAFYGCSSLTSITIPNSVTSIGASAFCNCSNLTSIEIPNSVTSIGKSAFEYCYALAEVYNLSCLNIKVGLDGNGYVGYYAKVIHASATAPSRIINENSIAYYVYDNEKIALVCLDKTLISVCIAYDCTSIGNYAFYNCSNLTSIVIPNSVTSIGNYAFYNCSNLTSIVIPNSVKSIGSFAFSGCSGLESITLPFVGDSIKIESDTYQYPFGYIFGNSSYTGGTIISQVYHGNSTSSTTSTTYYIPKSLRSVTITGGNILYGAFYNCSMLTSVTISNSVTSIGDYAFCNCSNLTSIIIPNSVTSIGNYAFYGCSGLTSIEIPSGVTSIGEWVFKNCINLSSVTIPNSVTSIGGSAFSGCSGLESITLPFVGDSIKTESDTYQYPFGYIFGNSSYTGGTIISQVYHGNSTSSTTSTNYYIPTSLRSVTITGGNILYGAFYNCSMLTSITIPNSVTSIGNYTFYNCSNLTSITISDSVTSIGYEAFENCSGLTSVTIPNSVTFIGYNAFYNCSNLVSVTLENPNNWKVGTSSISSSNLRNKSTAAKYLRDTYRSYIWSRT